MKRWTILLLGLLPILGVVACNANRLPAATPAGFVRLEASPTASKIHPGSTPTISAATGTVAPADSPLLPTSLTPQPATPLPSASPTCQETAGNIQDQQLESEFLDEPLHYLVYLPPCYDEQNERHYPVLYLFHGQTYSNQHWIDLGATQIADRLISKGELAPFIMVFPYDQNHYDPPPGNAFGQAVVSELIPAIDHAFRTMPTRAARAIGGISRGGNWAAHLSLQHPILFGAVGLHSTPIFSTDTNKEITEWIEAIPVDEFPRLFLDVGESDRWLAFTLVFEELLNAASVPHEWYLYPGFHEDAYWQSHLEQYIRWYAQAW